MPFFRPRLFFECRGSSRAVGRVDELFTRRNLLLVALIHAVHSGASLFLCRPTHLLFLRTASTIAFSVHLEDGRMMNEAVDGCEGHRWINENVSPLREGRICCDGDTFAFVAFSDQLKERRGFGLIAPDVAQIVEDQEW
jgi:hypothetical protein